MATYGSVQTTSGVSAHIVIPYQIDRPALIYGTIFWGDVAGEFEILINGNVVAGGRTSPQSRTLQLDFSAAPIGIQAGDDLVINAVHYELGLRTLKIIVLVRGA